MKKNRMMRLASLLLVCVLLTTSVISGTFAKYTASDDVSDEARVAAWGFGTTEITFDLFDAGYEEGDVLAKDGTTNLIAPGTAKTDKVKLTYADTTGLGAPEVAYKVELNVTAHEVSNAIEDNENITWTFNGNSYDKFDAMVTAIEAYEVEVEANKLPTIAETGLAIGWEWAFSSDAAGDTADTAMGNAALDNEVSLTIEFVATQIGD